MAVLKGLGEFHGKAFPLEEGGSDVGRMEGHVVVTHGSVSGKHARLWCEERWYLQDLGSRNGTGVNGKGISGEETFELRDGDEVSFGAVRLRFEEGGAGGRAARGMEAAKQAQALADRLTNENAALHEKLKVAEADLKDREEALDEWERRMHEVNATWVSREDLALQVKTAEERIKADTQRQVDAAMRRALEIEKRFVQASAKVETLERALKEKEELLARRPA